MLMSVCAAKRVLILLEAVLEVEGPANGLPTGLRNVLAQPTLMPLAANSRRSRESLGASASLMIRDIAPLVETSKA